MFAVADSPPHVSGVAGVAAGRATPRTLMRSFSAICPPKAKVRPLTLTSPSSRPDPAGASNTTRSMKFRVPRKEHLIVVSVLPGSFRERTCPPAPGAQVPCLNSDWWGVNAFVNFVPAS